MNRRAIFGFAVGFMMGAACLAPAEEVAAPSQRGWSKESLAKMLEPIALYPDPLLAQMLAAAAQPSDIVVADRFVRAGVDPRVIDQQTWDTSVKGLTRYPDVLKWMDENIVWTTAVGEAFVSQEADVMEAIQRLRAKAKARGNLRTTPQQEVVEDNGTIEIVPASPNAMFVPDYEPSEIFDDAPPTDGNWMLFGVGLPIGGWLAYDMDWHHHHICVWPTGHPRPPGWWHHEPGNHAGSTFVDHGAILWQARPRTEESRFWEETRFGSGRQREVPTVIGPRGIIGRMTPGSEGQSGGHLPETSGDNRDYPARISAAHPGVVGGGNGFAHPTGGGTVHGSSGGGSWFGGGGHSGGGGGWGGGGHSGGGGGGHR